MSQHLYNFEFVIIKVIKLEWCTYKNIIKSRPVFVRLSGFLKTTFLKSTQKKKFLRANFPVQKVSGFRFLPKSRPILQQFCIGNLVQYWFEILYAQFSCPECWNPVFWKLHFCNLLILRNFRTKSGPLLKHFVITNNY